MFSTMSHFLDKLAENFHQNPVLRNSMKKQACKHTAEKVEADDKLYYLLYEEGIEKHWTCMSCKNKTLMVQNKREH